MSGEVLGCGARAANWPLEKRYRRAGVRPARPRPDVCVCASCWPSDERFPRKQDRSSPGRDLALTCQVRSLGDQLSDR